MNRLPPLIPELQQIKRRIWILIFGGALLFIGTAMLLAAMNPTTPANQLVDRDTIWLFAPSAGMAVYGAYVRCAAGAARCGLPLPTKFPVKPNCPRSGSDLRSPV